MSPLENYQIPFSRREWNYFLYVRELLEPSGLLALKLDFPTKIFYTNNTQGQDFPDSVQDIWMQSTILKVGCLAQTNF
jgi:hypothetical protein